MLIPESTMYAVTPLRLRRVRVGTVEREFALIDPVQWPGRGRLGVDVARTELRVRLHRGHPGVRREGGGAGGRGAHGEPVEDGVVDGPDLIARLRGLGDEGPERGPGTGLLEDDDVRGDGGAGIGCGGGGRRQDGGRREQGGGREQRGECGHAADAR
ncbi:hypothetical protein GCM10020254_54460 [Streptomyces goshikiensis]